MAGTTGGMSVKTAAAGTASPPVAFAQFEMAVVLRELVMRRGIRPEGEELPDPLDPTARRAKLQTYRLRYKSA